MKTGLHPGITVAVVIGGNGVVIHCRRSCIALLVLVLKTFFLSSLPHILSIPTALSVVDIIWKLVLWNKVCKGAGSKRAILVARHQPLKTDSYIRLAICCSQKHRNEWVHTTKM